MTGSAPGAPSASALSVETPATGTPSASARPRAVDRPMRTPVKLPGPIPTASASMSRVCVPAWRRSASTSSSSVTAREVRSPSTSPSATSALVATSVAVSNARISIALNRDKPRPAGAVLEPDAHARRRQDAGAGLGPLDEHDGVVEVRLEVPPLRRRDVAKAKEVEMRDVDAAVVPVADRERRARDRLRHTERAARAPHESRLARAELAGDGDDVTGLQIGDQARRELLGLRRRVSLAQNKPSWTAGCAVAGVRKIGCGGGVTSRPMSSGMRPKSAFRTSSIRGV